MPISVLVLCQSWILGGYDPHKWPAGEESFQKRYVEGFNIRAPSFALPVHLLSWKIYVYIRHCCMRERAFSACTYVLWGIRACGGVPANELSN